MKQSLTAIFRWFDSGAGSSESDEISPGIDWARVIPFVAMHFSVLAIIWVGVSPIAVFAAVFSYYLRMFGITGWYHRYFSHRTFKASRFVQFCGAFLGSSATQRGPLWWAAHHRVHHRKSDEPEDPHSRVQHGFFISHMGWFMNRVNFRTRVEEVPDLAKYPELRLLDRIDLIAPVLYATAWFFIGMGLNHWWPSLGTSAGQMLVWGYFISTVALFHGTFTINSLAHMWGSRRYDTTDTSRNNFFLSLITMGEGWHNNHHYYPGTARQGFRWWEFDPTYYILKLMEKMRLISEVRGVPERVLKAGKRSGKPKRSRQAA